MQNANNSEGGPSRTAEMVSLVFLLIACVNILWPLPKALFKQSDVFWLIESGSNILHHAALPASDPYSFTSVSNHWIVYQWLSEVAFSLANVFGLFGVSLLGELTLALLLCVLVFRRTIKLGANAIITCIVVGIVTNATYPDIAALRPQLFSFVLLFILQAILEDVWSAVVPRRQLKNLLAKTLIIGVVWVNCHASFPFGLSMLILYLCAAIARSLALRGKDKGEHKDCVTIFAWMTGVFFGATFINPYGAKLWIFLQWLFTVYPTQEMQPLDWAHCNPYLLVYVVMFLATLGFWRSIAATRLIWGAMIFIAGCLHARFLIYFCICTSPLVSEVLSRLLSGFTRLKVIEFMSDTIETAISSKLYPMAVIALSIASVYFQPLYMPTSIPVEAAEYLNSHKVSGNLFSSAHAGSYLIYRFHGAIKVFMDTRIDLYDPALCTRFVAALSGLGWKELFQEYKITETLLPNSTPLANIIGHDSGWKVIYKDDEFSIATSKHTFETDESNQLLLR